MGRSDRLADVNERANIAGAGINLAQRAGERDTALQQLAQFAKLPVWDEIRGDPRCKQIIAEAEKPVKLN